MNAVDFTDRLRSRDLDSLFSSSHPSLAGPPSTNTATANTISTATTSSITPAFSSSSSFSFSAAAADATLPSSLFDKSEDLLSFPSTADLSFEASAADLAFAASRLAYDSEDSGSSHRASRYGGYHSQTNDLSLTSGRTSSKKAPISRLNIPA